MEPRERLQFPRPVQQPRDGLPRVGQVGPGMTHALRPRVGDRRQPLARRHQPLAEPIVARRRAEEVAEPHDQRRRPLAARRVQPPFQLHADAALFRDRVLRRILLEHGKRIVPVVVNRARQHDPRPHRLCRGHRVVDHRQHQLAPVAAVRRVHRVYDRLRPLRRAAHVGPLHRVARHPLGFRERPRPLRPGAGIARHRDDLPAVPQQRRGGLAPDAARRPQHTGAAFSRLVHAVPPAGPPAAARRLPGANSPAAAGFAAAAASRRGRLPRPPQARPAG